MHLLSLAALLTTLSTATPAPPRFDKTESLELFHELVAKVRERHVFSPVTEKNLGRAWADDLPLLEKEFGEATTVAELSRALWHFQNSLHDRHCWYRSHFNVGWLLAGFTADVEWVDGKPRYYVVSVEDAELAKKVRPGDFIEEVDGVSATRFLDAFRLESNANNLRGLSIDIAEHLGRRRTLLNGIKEGDPYFVRFRPRQGGDSVVARLTWRAPSRPRRPSANGPIHYDSKACAGLPERSYGPYSLQGAGLNYCLYTSDKPPFDAYPIVRAFSFDYTSGPQSAEHLLRVERRWLEQALASLPSAKGVVLDLRDNKGGNDASWFLDWWAPAAYTNHFVDYRLYDSLAEFRAAAPVGFDGESFSRYAKVLETRKAGQEFWLQQPFFQRPDGCGAKGQCVPSHQVTRLPIALLVGPECMSTCDAFAQIFLESRFGPLVGQPPAGAYSLRAQIPAVTPRTKVRLGVINVAFTRQLSGKSGEVLEGFRLKLDVPVESTFANRSRYDAMLVESAIKALGVFGMQRAKQGSP